MSIKENARGLRELADMTPSLSDIQRSALHRVAAQLESDAKRFENSQKLQDIGKSAMESIAEMVAALDCDYDRLEELRADMAEYKNSPALMDASDKQRHVEIAGELAELEEAAGECKDREEAEQRIQEDPLSIELSGTWSLNETPTADKAIILLGTGGPATRIVCELDGNMEPHRAWIQAQDWFQPWTDYVGSDSDTLLSYCRCFYFGEG